ncbi:MAG: hypothetical protein HY744_22270 [Deltaproteobacteria bacterium]|nr:hypothetical protein [Deltaproteobacteria bacterium]
MTFVPWAAFKPWVGTRWRRRKQKLQERLLERLLARLPGLQPMVRHVELSTPLSTELFCRPVQGAIYGVDPTPERFTSRWLRPRSPVPGASLHPHAAT